MAKLHELLAVKTNLDGQADKAVGDQKDLFNKKRHHFGSQIKQFTPLAEGSKTTVEEQSEIQTTVAKELEWLSGIFAKHMDNTYQIDIANTQARADVVLEDDKDTVLLKNVPTTALLAMEGQITKIQELVTAIPTLDPSKGFMPDAQKGPGYFQARETVNNRTKKVKKVLIKYEATKEHPAQTEVYDADEVTGTLRTQEWSTLVTPAQKADMLDRCDILLRAVRRARSRANDFEIETSGNKVGKAVLSYVFGF